MFNLSGKVTDALNESRILILGTQVLIGFQFRSFIESGFTRLPASSQYLSLASLVSLLVAIGLLMSPAAYHRLVAHGEDTPHVYDFTTNVMTWALVPLGLALGVEVYIVSERLMKSLTAGLLGLAVILTAAFFWYFLEWWTKRHDPRRHGPPKSEEPMKKSSGKTPLAKKVEHVLTEARLVLPGAQALLGFQLATVLLEEFDRLPRSSQYIHLASLALMTLCVILLMTPPAYHRIVERGEESERFHQFATRILLAAMCPLACGIAGDVFVVVRKVTESLSGGIAAAAAALVFFFGLWFGLMLWLRHREGSG